MDDNSLFECEDFDLEDLPEGMIFDDDGNIIVPPIASDTDSMLTSPLNDDGSLSDESIAEEKYIESNAIPVVSAAPSDTPTGIPTPSDKPSDHPICISDSGL